jgi:transposase
MDTEMGDPEKPDPRDQEIERLRRENEHLRAEVEELKRRIAELEKKLEEAVRGQKRQTAPFSKGPPKKNPKRRGRKPGEEYGAHACREAPREIDEVLHAPLPECCECGGKVVYDHTEPQFQEEIPRKPIRRRIDIEFGHCDRCGKPAHGRHRLQTSDAVGAAAVQLGPDAKAMTSLMKNELGLSCGKIRTAFQRFFGISISRGGVAQIVGTASDRVHAAYRSIAVVVRRSRTVYPDETGWKVAGRLQWMWTFVCRTATLFIVRDSRGFDVVEEVLGAKWSGDVIHDGWAPYDRLEEADHQQCLQHPIRRCKRLLEVATGGAVRYPRAVLGFLQDAFAVRDRREAGEYSPHGLKVAIGRLEGRLERLLDWKLTHPANVKLRNHLAKHEDEWLPFLKRPWIEGTSWPVDQEMRGALANRKVFGGNRDPRGARAQERLSSVIATAVKRGVEIVGYLARVLCAPFRKRDRLACELLGLPPPAR